MGLSICRSIIEAHGGRLWAIPCEPQGALFQFTILLTEPPSVIDVAYWRHRTDTPTLLSDVRSWVNSGKHLLAASISHFDPFRTSERWSIDVS